MLKCKRVTNMLDIEIEPFRGILFIRLSGILNRSNINKLNSEVNNLIREIEAKNIVFNINDLKSIDIYGQNAIINSLRICRHNHGRSLICIGNNRKIIPLIEKLMTKTRIVKDELTALNFIKEEVI